MRQLLQCPASVPARPAPVPCAHGLLRPDQRRCRRYQNAAAFYQFHSKRLRARKGFRDRNPHKHGCLRLRNLPANSIQAVAEHITTFLISCTGGLHTGLVSGDGCDGCPSAAAGTYRNPYWISTASSASQPPDFLHRSQFLHLPGHRS